MVTKKQNKEEKMKREIKSWKETCEIVADPEIMKSIQKSLQEIAQGKGIPLAQL